MRSSRRDSRHRWFFALGVLAPALSIGATVILLTVAYRLWIESRPVPDPDRVVVALQEGGNGSLAFTPAGMERLREAAGFSRVAGQVLTTGRWAPLRLGLRTTTTGRELVAAGVTPDYFRTLGLTVAGRDFVASDDDDQRPPMAIISDETWRTEFDGRSDAIGALLPVHPESLLVIGIAPRGFTGARLGEHIDVWLPSRTYLALCGARRVAAVGEDPPYFAFARLIPGDSPDGARRRLALTPQRRFQHLSFVPINRVFGASDARMVAIRPGQLPWILAATCLLLVLGACVTQLGSALIYYQSRGGELATRLMLGAPRGSIVGLLVRELLALGAGGTMVAAAVAAAGLSAIPRIVMANGIDLEKVDLDVTRATVLMAWTLLTGCLLAGAALPLRRAISWDPKWNHHGNPTNDLPFASGLRRAVVIGHVVFTMLALVIAGGLLRSVRSGLSDAPGFDIRHTLFVDVQTPVGPLDTENDTRQAAVAQKAKNLQVLEQLRSLPGIDAAALGASPLGSERLWELQFSTAIHTRRGITTMQVGRLKVDPSYTSVIGARCTGASGIDVAGSTPTAVITRSLSDRLFPGGSATGEALTLFGTTYVVRGISDVAFGSVKLGRPPVLLLSDVHALPKPGSFAAVARTAYPDALKVPARKLLETHFPGATDLTVETGLEQAAADLGSERVAAWFLAGVAAVEVAVSMAVVFGFVAYAVQSRRREIALRLAAGADYRHVLGAVVTTSLTHVAVGCTGGLAATALTGDALSRMWPDVVFLNVDLFVVAAVLCLGTAGLSAGLGAWRITRISPAELAREA